MLSSDTKMSCPVNKFVLCPVKFRGHTVAVSAPCPVPKQSKMGSVLQNLDLVYSRIPARARWASNLRRRPAIPRKYLCTSQCYIYVTHITVRKGLEWEGKKEAMGSLLGEKQKG